MVRPRLFVHNNSTVLLKGKIQEMANKSTTGEEASFTSSDIMAPFVIKKEQKLQKSHSTEL